MEEAERSPPVDPDFFKLLEETLHDPDYEHIWGSTSDEPTHSTSHLQEPYTTTNNVSPFSHSVEDVHTVENVPSEPNTATDSTPFSLDNETVTILRKYDVLPSMVPEAAREKLLQISKRYLPPEDEARGPARNRRRRNKTKALGRFVQSLFKEAGTLPQKRSAADAFESTANATPPASDTTQETNPLTFTFQEMVDKETKQVLLQIALDVSVVVGNFGTLLAKIICRWRPPHSEVAGPDRNQRRLNKRRGSVLSCSIFFPR